MPNIIMPEIYCPLCEQPMVQRKAQYLGKILILYVCKPCEIGIYDFDPAFNKWRDADKKIPCSHCGFGEIKWFIRYLDGFFKSKCPQCGAVMKKDSDVKLGGRGQLVLPEEMEPEEVEEPVDLYIPINHLEKKFGKDRLRGFIEKRKRGKTR